VPPEDRGMGMVFQNYAVWPHKTVFENVVFGLRVRRVAAAAAREQVGRALALVNLVGYEDRLPGELSGGQQQRVALARSLVVEPEILLLDEPLSNLDAKLRERMRSELKQLQRRTGITFIYVTHDQAEALALSDHIAVMHGGRLEQFGTPDDVYRRPASRTVADFMGHVNFVAGQLTALERDHATVMVAGTLAISAAAPPGAKVGDAVDVAVRPEDMRIGPGDAGAVEGIPAQLTDRTYLGNLIEYQALLASGETVRVQTHPSAQFSVGEKIKVDMARAHLNVFARGEDRTATGTSDRE
ncbi:MAG: ABC transporter ATP-binding protein, partial [Proteobacteria bacterium]|nr:ABC transporter ATP-binding protein [Pseudomonadota bacterium]